MSKVLDHVCNAVRDSGQSRYAIAKATGIPQSQLSRLVNKQQALSIDTLEILADHLGLELILRPKRKQHKGK